MNRAEILVIIENVKKERSNFLDSVMDKEIITADILSVIDNYNDKLKHYSMMLVLSKEVSL